SFCFGPEPRLRRPVVTPTEFIENLVGRLVAAIEKGSFNAFHERLQDAIDYHRFLLAALNNKDAEGTPLNLATVGGFFERPDQKWVREYRAAYEAAASKIAESTKF